MTPVPIVTYLDAQRRMEVRALATLEQPKLPVQSASTDIENRIEEADHSAYMKGYEAGKSEAFASMETRARESEEHLRQSRTTKAQEELTAFKTSLQKEMARFRRELEDNLSIIMRSLLDKSLSERNKREVRQAIRTLVNLSGTAEITVTGSVDLIEALRETFASSRLKIEFVEHDEEQSIRIEADQTLISSKFEKWRQEIDDLFLVGT